MKRRNVTAIVLLAAVHLASFCGAQEKLEKFNLGVAGLSGALARTFVPVDDR